MINSRTYFYAPIIAIALLTRLPVTGLLPGHWNERDQGVSTLYYPFVGLLIGVLIFIAVSLLPEHLPSLLLAAIIVTLWVMITGALHLDGLADSVDAAFASHSILTAKSSVAMSADADSQLVQQRQRILKVFKDPAAGPMAVIALVLLLLLKFSVLAVWPQDMFLGIFCALMLSRAMAVLFIISTPYAREVGLGAILVMHTPKQPAIAVVVATAISLFFIFPFVTVMALLLVLGIFFMLWRGYWLRTIGGFVGDCIGGLIEITEVLVLLILFIAIY